MQQSSAVAKATKTYLLLTAMLILSVSSFAHRVELYSNTGCASGNTLTVTAAVLYAPNTTYYNWQYKDNTGNWKYFTASSTVNGTAFTVSGYENGPAANYASTLSIANATTALENVQVRVLMAEGVRPRLAGSNVSIWGGDDEGLNEVKMFRLHVYSSPTDCGGTTPGCLGNVLVSGSNYYGGFENMAYNSASSVFTNNNFGSNASTEYTQGGNGSTSPSTSGSGTYQILNNPFGMNTGNGKFAPHTGNFQMVVHATSNTIRKAWYKTVTVVPGAVYNFSAWIARTQGSNSFSVKLTVNNSPVNTTSVSNSIGTWNQMAGSYTVPAGVTSVVIAVTDASAGSADRYFSLDDICFTQTTAMMTLGNRVWYDTDNDGINDASENGIKGITVRLYKDANADNVADGAAVATTTTDANGYYSFAALNAGRYIVGAVVPNGYMSSAVNAVNPDNNTDLDDNGVTLSGNEIRGNGITLSAGLEPAGNTNNTYDFGMLPDCTCTSAAGNLLTNASFENGTTGWNWSSANGSLTTGTGYVACGAKNGFNNWSSGTSKVWQDVTGIAGASYTFKGFAGIHTPGLTCSPKLSMIFLNAANAVIGQTDVAVTRDVDVYNSQLEQYTITATAPPLTAKVRIQSSTTCNTMKLDAFCLTVVNPYFTLGNTVFYDTNNNGIQNTGENGIKGIAVNLYKDADNNNVPDGAAIATDVTDINGEYSFGMLTAGNYIVGAVIPAGYMKSAVSSADPDNNIDLDNNGVTLVGTEVRGNAITLSAGAEPGGNTNDTYDFGMLPDCTCTASASNLLVNGSFENGTTGWNWPSANGNLTTGTGYVACGAANGFNNWTSGTSKVYQDVVTMPGAVLTFKGFAGTHTPGISCSPKLSMIFLNAAGTAIGQTDVTVTRDVDVNNSQLEQYTIVGTAPALTAKVRIQSSITCNTMKMDAFCLTVVNPSLTIGNTVWYDANNNGTLDAGENGISGVTVKLYDAAGVYLNKTAVTDATGNYQLINLTAGSYIVGITTPAGYTKSDVGTTNVAADNQNDGVSVVTTEIRTTAFAITASTNNIDFGLKATGSIGDFVFSDNNGNGQQDAGEAGIAGVTVTLTGTGFTTRTTTTNSLGIYSFTGLVAGTYTVTFTTPAGLTPTVSNAAGVSDAADSDPIAGAAVVTLAAGASDLTIDAGFYSTVRLGNFVYFDKNNNGTQDAGEPGIGEVAVSLFKDANTDNTPDGAAIASTSTNPSGNYSFANLAPGSYIVAINVPNGYTQATTTATSADPNNDNNTDNNGVTLSGSQLRTNFVTLVAGAEPAVAVDGDDTNGNLTVDLGLKATGAIGDFVWNDLNRNGIQDAGEPGIAGATVTLTLPDATTRTTTTNAQGIYTFDNLRSGNYTVSFPTPATYFRTVSNSTAPGATDLNDSDPINGAVAVTLSAGQVNNTIDAGFFRKINISGNIWHDANGNFDNEVNQTSPVPIPVGMILYLVDDNTGIIEQALSPEYDGTYIFEDVRMNTSYRLVLSTTVADPGDQAPMPSLPTGWTNTGENLGAGPNSGSDGISDGMLYIDTQSSDIFNANFGIKLGNGEIIIG